MKAELDERGFFLWPTPVSAVDLTHLLAVVASELAVRPAKLRGVGTYAIRNLLVSHIELAHLLEDAGLDAMATQALGTTAVPIDATYFDKNTETNWKVPAHQDLVVPAAAAPAGSESVHRYGTEYTEPPIDYLRRLVALRLHFDDCAEANGALAVIPGSHHAKLGDAGIAALDQSAFVLCPAPAGSVLLMKPLLVHRSSSARQPSTRRVLHVVYGPKVNG